METNASDSIKSNQSSSLLQNIIDHYRIGVDAKGSDNLEALIIKIQLLLSAGLLSSMSNADAVLINNILSTLERSDFLFLADLLENEFYSSVIWQELLKNEKNGTLQELAKAAARKRGEL